MTYPIRIGTSGWNYPQWQGMFYPAGQPKSRWLEYYAGQFDTVELNAAFYRLPDRKTFENWRLRTPEHFLWAVKASKYITHIKRLKDPHDSLEKFFSNAAGLGDKLGPILFQIPPSLAFDAGLATEFFGFLTPGRRYAIEPRHASWMQDEAYSLLQAYGIALCISDSAGRFPYAEAVTANFVYIRLHGSQKLYASEYSEKELQSWAEKIRKWGKPSFIYFDNDYLGFAVQNARRLKQILGQTLERRPDFK